MAKPSRDHHKKRHGKHQKRTPHFMRTYLPYMPLVLIISTMLVLGFGRHRAFRGVLSYATNVSTQSLLQDTNGQRSANDVKALTLNSRLSAAAQAKANDMAIRNYWSHNTPDGNPPWVFIDNSGYSYSKAGENLAYGFVNSEDTITGWMNSPSHRENLLDSSFSEVGFGLANVANYQHHGQETIVVAMYGQPSAAPQPTSTQISANLPTPKEPAFTTLGATTIAHEPVAKKVAIAQVLTKGQLPWLSAALLLSGVLCLFVLVVKHSLALKKVLVKGERYAIKHPLFDITTASFVALCILLVQNAGLIR